VTKPDASLPPYAYVPGKTPRHPEGWFDTIRMSAQPGMAAADLEGSDAFRAGLLFRAEGYFWEAHEVLEPVWMACDPETDPRTMVQALIQLANAQLKLRMDRPKAALRLIDIVLGLLDKVTQPQVLGQVVGSVRAEALQLRELVCEL
jgi:hypothetical protein